MHLVALFSGFGQFLPPDLSPSYVYAELGPLWQTVEIAAGGMLFALSVGLVLALIVGSRVPGSRFLYAGLVALRSIPDLSLAILCVVLVGIGPGAGMLAIALFYGATMGKVGADLFVSADPGPVESLSATGAPRFAVALYGLLPLRLKDLMTFGAYDFECAMRASVIVGAVGAGGIGAELVGTINEISYRRSTTLVLLLVILIGIFDKLTHLIRKYPVFLIGIVLLGVYSAWDLWPRMFAYSHTLDVLHRMLPPRLSAEQIYALPGLIGETLLIAFAGTALALLFAIPLGAAAARNVGPAFIHVPVKRLLELLRAVPEVIWGLILVSMAVMGVPAGIFALGVHNMGVFGKLYAECIENVQQEPVMALAATGAPGLAVVAFGHLPLAFPPMVVQTLFRLEWNIRAATVVGMIGAGGIGTALYNAQQQFFYDQMLAYLLVTWLLVILTDQVNSYLRKRWKVAEVTAKI